MAGTPIGPGESRQVGGVPFSEDEMAKFTSGAGEEASTPDWMGIFP